MPTSTIARKARAMTLRELASTLRDGVGLLQKKEIQAPAELLPWSVTGPWGSQVVRLGDDCAAIPDEQGHLLFAIEGISPELVASSPRAAGYCAVLVNASDIYSMGGRPLAVVDAVFSRGSAATQAITLGMQRAAAQLGIPIVGGHTNLHSPYDALAVSIVGRATKLITSFDAARETTYWSPSTYAARCTLAIRFGTLPTLPASGCATIMRCCLGWPNTSFVARAKTSAWEAWSARCSCCSSLLASGRGIRSAAHPEAPRHSLVALAGRLPELWFRARSVARTLRTHSPRLCRAAHRLRTYWAGRCQSTTAARR